MDFQSRRVNSDIWSCVFARLLLFVMVAVAVVVHSQGLHPIDAVTAWLKRTHEDMSVDQIIQEGQVLNMPGTVLDPKAI